MATKKDERPSVQITAPNIRRVGVPIVGVSPYVQNRFSAKGREIMRATQEAGSASKKGKKREPKDFQALYEAAKYHLPDAAHGIPAAAFRCALISACRLCGFKMTIAKQAVFVVADGFDEEDGTPLVRITKGDPQYYETAVRNATGVVDLRARAMWREGWEAVVTIEYDADMFSAEDVVNLLSRAGAQVGVGEGRMASKGSGGMGWGVFQVQRG